MNINLFIFKFFSAITQIIIVCIIPIIIGLSIRTPIKGWICAVATFVIFVGFMIANQGDITGVSVYSSIIAWCFLYLGSRRKRKKDVDNDGSPHS